MNLLGKNEIESEREKKRVRQKCIYEFKIKYVKTKFGKKFVYYINSRS